MWSMLLLFVVALQTVSELWYKEHVNMKHTESCLQKE
uniref:Uncharacterized protein n=1 Tax=Arundo donax TaxID=35708 RepID=A0A0A9H578_ARUDO